MAPTTFRRQVLWANGLCVKIIMNTFYSLHLKCPSGNAIYCRACDLDIDGVKPERSGFTVYWLYPWTWLMSEKWFLWSTDLNRSYFSTDFVFCAMHRITIDRYSNLNKKSFESSQGGHYYSNERIVWRSQLLKRKNSLFLSPGKYWLRSADSARLNKIRRSLPSPKTCSSLDRKGSNWKLVKSRVALPILMSLSAGLIGYDFVAQHR